jgi:hypothetical protein
MARSACTTGRRADSRPRATISLLVLGRCEATTNTDTDGDGVVDACDVCVYAADPEQSETDGDGFGDACDCEAADPLAFPDATERCNGIDDSCDGALPAGEADADADGWRGCDGDCDDGDPSRHPGAAEGCSAADDDCDPTTEPPASDCAEPEPPAGAEAPPPAAGCGCRTGGRAMPAWPVFVAFALRRRAGHRPL